MPEDRDESKRGEAKNSGAVSRRDFLRLGAVAGAGVPLAGLVGASEAGAAAQELPSLSAAAIQLEEATIAQMQAAMARGGLTSLGLVNMYLERIASIDESGPTVNSVLEVNPDARRIARQLDRERKAGARARPAARHPDPAEGEHRHRRPHADDGRLAGPDRRSRPTRTPPWPPGCARRAP